MDSAVAIIVPLGLGVALSPVPIVVVLLMLGTRRPRTNGIAYVIGFAAGLCLLCLLVALFLHDREAHDPRTTSVLVAWGSVALGVLLLGLGSWSWRRRGRRAESPALPSWLGRVEHLNPFVALGLGAVNSGVNVKNLALILAASAEIGKANLNPLELTAETTVFLLVGMLGVAVPVLLYLLQGVRAERTLDGWKLWLLTHNATVMALLMLLFGILLIGRGLTRL